jgi:hypothetical protein
LTGLKANDTIDQEDEPALLRRRGSIRRLTVAGEIVRAVSLCVALLFVVAVGHKVQILRAGEAAAEPLIKLGGWRKRHASTAIALAGIAETALAVLLVTVPLVGLVGASLLLVLYAREVRRLPADQPCNCFGGVIRTHAGAAAVRRNAGLAVVTAAGFVGYATGAVDVAPLSETVAGIALILVGAMAAAEALRRLEEPTRQAGAIRG